MAASTRAAFCWLLSAAAMSAFAASRVAIVAPASLPAPARHGLTELSDAFRTKGLTVSSDSADLYVIAGLGGDAGPESLAIRRTIHQGKPAIAIEAADGRGLMYAAFDVADRVALAAAADPFALVRETRERPYIAERAVSMYTMHRGLFERRLFDQAHWKRYFDMLARSRINSFVVIFGYENGGFMAPLYPYFFDTPGFPGVRLVGATPERQRRNRDAFRAMIRIAHERGVDVTAAIWDHIYRGGVQGGGIPGASELAGRETPGLVTGLTSKNLMPYTRSALRQFLETFPELDAIQFRMHGESGLERGEMESFWHDVFATVRQLRPAMRVDLRAKELPDAIIDDALRQGLKVRVTTKHWMEQMGLPFHPTHVNPQNQRDRRHGYADLLRNPRRYKVHWRLWNGGTARFLLWGDPEYVRRFSSSARLFGGDSFEINEMLATWMLGEPHGAEPRPVLNPRYRYFDYEYERYWHFYQLWGRLAYNPQTPPEVWEREFGRRFGAAGPSIMNAVHLASEVLPMIVAAAYRYQGFPTTRGWPEMQRQGSLPQYAGLEGSDVQQFLSPRREARRILSGALTAMRRPEETSGWFKKQSERILELAARAGTAKPANELLATLADVRVLAWLARYHSERLPAAVHYNLYRETGDLFSFDEAIAGEKRAVAAWERLVEAAGDVYQEDLAFGAHAVGFSRHWKEELGYLRRSLEGLLEERRQAPHPKPGAIAHAPVRRAEPGSSIRIRATVGGSETPALMLSASGSEFRPLSMARVADGMFEAVIPAGEASLRYFLETASARFPSSGAIGIEVSTDRQPPSVRLDPAPNARAGQDLTISVRVQDPSGLQSVRLRYRRTTQYDDYEVAEMKPARAGGYAATIPGAFLTPEWDLMYFIEAVDMRGNGRMYPDLASETPYVVVPVASGTASSR